MTPLLNALSWIIGLLPLRGALAFGRALGLLLALCARRKREVVQRIQTCLGVSNAEASQIRTRMYKNLGMTIVEFLRMPHMTESEVRRHLRFEGLEHIPSQGTPALALVAHTGNWELMAAACGLFVDTPLHIVVKALKPDSLNAWVTRVRSRWGTTVHDRRGSARNLLKVLQQGHVLGFILDQNAKRNWGVFVEFFGMNACTSDGLSQFAVKKSVPAYPVFCFRNPDHSLSVTVGKAIPPPKSADPEQILAHTQHCTRIIEDFIRLHPDQWIWMHRRWRTQPLPDPAPSPAEASL